MSPKTQLRRIQALGTERSYVLTLPKEFAEEMHLSKGSYVRCDMEDGRLVVRRVDV